MIEYHLPARGRHMDEFEALQRAGAFREVRRGKVLREREERPGPVQSVDALICIAMLWLGLAAYHLVFSVFGPAFGIESWFAKASILAGVGFPLAILMGRVARNHAPVAAERALNGRTGTDKALGWWIRGSLRWYHVFFAILVTWILIPHEAFLPLVPARVAALQNVFIDGVRALLMTGAVVLLVAVRVALQGKSEPEV